MKKLLLTYSPQQKDSLHLLKPFLSGAQVKIMPAPPMNLLPPIITEAKKQSVDGIILMQEQILERLLGFTTGVSLNDYAGSIIDFQGFEWLVLNEPERLITIGKKEKFVVDRYVSKLTRPEIWFPQTEFIWEIVDESSVVSAYDSLRNALYIAVDIESFWHPEFGPCISCVSYTGVYLLPDGSWVTRSYVVPFISEFFHAWIQKLNALPVPKIFQGGLYDNAYFFRFNAPVRNWKLDTLSLFHAWYSELPKRLDFLATFSLRKVQFWKDEGKTGNLEDHYRYNARDGWGTANVFLSLMREIPQWAIDNYVAKFPLVFGCHQAEMTGYAIEEERRADLEVEQTKIVTEFERSLGKMVGNSAFNPRSPAQTLRLIHVLGHTKFKNADEKAIKKVAYSDPFAGRILDDILTVRKASKILGTYLKKEKFWKGRNLYRLDPDGTDTGRLASRESSFFRSKDECYGFQTQNTPTGVTTAPVRSMVVADPGFHFGEADYEQAEARDTGYLSGDPGLIEAVDGGRDFHALNASRFFGLSYETIFDDALKKTINKAIRDLSKRTNHGATYNMGWSVLIDTMGLENIFRARDLLKLPKFWSARQIAEYLLASYDKAYPTVRSNDGYYGNIKYRVRTTQMLVSPLGWTRYCFGDPDKSKQDLNALVAHPSQNLNAGTLNIAWKRIFVDIALREPRDFKLCAQIHDSVLFQYRIGREDLIRRVRDTMLMDVPVTDYKGITRLLRVPVAVKAGARRWTDLEDWKFSEEEKKEKVA